MKEVIPYKLYATCILVKGYARSTVCDLQRNRVYPIPNILFEILQNRDLFTVEAVKNHYGRQYSEVIDEYFSFLFQEELIFFTKTPESFPPLSLQWNSPSSVTNAILDIGIPIAYDLEKVLSQLDELGCRKIEIRCYDPLTPSTLSVLLEATTDSVINSIGIIARFNPEVPENSWQQLCDNYVRVTSVTLHGSPETREIISDTFLTPIRFIATQITGAHCCGVIHEDHFTSLVEPVSEAHLYNSCLNRKIGIDLEGNIKNCPSMSRCFGHVGNTSLAEVVGRSEFQQVWHIGKDQVKICRDCEFRYVCTDCRAYLEVPADVFSKPLKCGYDPYTAEWSDWSSNPLKTATVKYYNMF